MVQSFMVQKFDRLQIPPRPNQSPSNQGSYQGIALAIADSRPD
jgi:hypothetical protein